ncbi:MAG: peptidyl-prolyl cis-trans isomerase [bacterium]
MNRIIRVPLLAVALASLFACIGCGKGQKETVIVRIGSGKVTAEQMEARLKSLPPQVAHQYEGEEGQRRFLDGFIEEETWYQAAIAAGLDKDEEVARQVNDSVRRVLIQNYFDRELRPYQVMTEEQIKKAYDENIADYTKAKEMKVRHIQTATRGEAESLRRRILAGEDMGKLAREHSINEFTAKEGGLMGYIPEMSSLIAYIGSCPKLTVAIDSTPLMEVSVVVDCPGNFQVIRVEEIVPEAPLPFDKVKEVIRRLKQPEFENQVRAERLEELKKKFGVEISSSGMQATAKSREEEAQSLFQRAQESQGWQERLDLYGEFMVKFPEHVRKPEALFMIGFIYAEELKDFAKAQETFNQLLKEHPDHKLAKDARFMLENLGAEQPPASADGAAETAAPEGEAPAEASH